MTKESLEQQKALLEADLEQAKAVLYRIDGALQLIKRLLAEPTETHDAV